MVEVKEMTREQRVKERTARQLKREHDEWERKIKEENSLIEIGMWLAFEELQEYSQKADKKEKAGIEKAKQVVREMQDRHENWRYGKISQI